MKVTPILTKLEPYINNAKLADVIFHVGKKKVEMYGHQFVLAINSKYLLKVFSSNTKIKTPLLQTKRTILRLPNINADSFLSILEFCYLRKTKITKDNVYQILSCSKKFELKELGKLCLNFLIKNLNDHNALKVYQIMLNYNEKNSAQTAYRYILKSKTVLKREYCFVGLNNQTIENILKSKNICVSEKHLANRLIENMLFKQNDGDNLNEKMKDKGEHNPIDLEKEKQKEGRKEKDLVVKQKRKKRRKITRSKSKVFGENKDPDPVVIYPQKDVDNNKGRKCNCGYKTEYASRINDSDHKNLKDNLVSISSPEKKKKLFNTQMISKITKICNNYTISLQTEPTEELWLQTDLILMEKSLKDLNQFSLARCLTEEGARRLDSEDLGLLSRIQWQRFLKRKYIKKFSKSGLFDKEKLNRYLAYLISDGDLSIIGSDGIKKASPHLSRCRKVQIKRSRIKVMLLAAQANKKRRRDVLRSIKSSGITHVTVYNLCKKTPSSLELKKYDVVFLYSLGKFRSPRICGNILADFVDNGGSVVVCTINCLRNDCNDRRELRGRFIEQDYLPIKRGKESAHERRKLSEICEKNHYIMKGIKKFDCGCNSWNISTKRVTRGSKIIAKYDNGSIMIAEKCLKNRGKVIVLNFFPVSDSVRNNDEYWKTNTNGEKIISNSIEYAYQK
ncbi:btb/poz domain-containing [Anaeramoeba flamelloides]|uniref:Btb/poz domain-containing n=1 Tax=Anaeramoeba flamelloides TaxID=1746091 RepID=A0ABQ8XFX5_9EUKA|nr:btb/poz domain-containing [Anaeramoeba flamelloides]